MVLRRVCVLKSIKFQLDIFAFLFNFPIAVAPTLLCHGYVWCAKAQISSKIESFQPKHIYHTTQACIVHRGKAEGGSSWF
uniref:Uncharacterized protein n=1 Tax=Anopheles darlingi TaxID=43151 RepID=A0A2M4DL51_ANODA